MQRNPILILDDLFQYLVKPYKFYINIYFYSAFVLNDNFYEKHNCILR